VVNDGVAIFTGYDYQARHKLAMKKELQQAVQTGNSAACNNLENEEQKMNCRSRIAANVSDSAQCVTVDESQRNYCYYHLAVKNLDIGLCASINGESDFPGGQYLEECYEDLAVAKKDYSICLSPPILASWMKNFKTWCLLNYAENTHDTKVCALIEDNPQINSAYYKEQCLRQGKP
jgi:hypothetical protein